MSLSMRAQVLGITALVLVPVGWLLHQSSLMTRREAAVVDAAVMWFEVPAYR
jgi:hypothetical protein